MHAHSMNQQGKNRRIDFYPIKLEKCKTMWKQKKSTSLEERQEVLISHTCSWRKWIQPYTQACIILFTINVIVMVILLLCVNLLHIQDMWGLRLGKCGFSRGLTKQDQSKYEYQSEIWFILQEKSTTSSTGIWKFAAQGIWQVIKLYYPISNIMMDLLLSLEITTLVGPEVIAP